LIPTLVRHRGRSGITGMTRTMKMLLGLLIPVSVAYLATLWGFRLALFRIFYGGNYREYSGLPILLVGLIPIAAGAAMVLGAGLRAIERPSSVFWGYVAASVSTVFLGLPLAYVWGVAGAAGGMLISSSTGAFSLAWLYHRRAQDMSC